MGVILDLFSGGFQKSNCLFPLLLIFLNSPCLASLIPRTEPPPSNGVANPGGCMWDFHGCKNELPDRRILPYRFILDQMTSDLCMSHCAERGFGWALVEYQMYAPLSPFI